MKLLFFLQNEIVHELGASHAKIFKAKILKLIRVKTHSITNALEFSYTNMRKHTSSLFLSHRKKHKKECVEQTQQASTSANGMAAINFRKKEQGVQCRILDGEGDCNTKPIHTHTHTQTHTHTHTHTNTIFIKLASFALTI